jgi:hypothetical protein
MPIISKTIDPKDSREHPVVTVAPPEASRLDCISVNWCDKTTWYPSSVEVTDETMTDSGDGLTFNPDTQRPWVDVTHGKITGEYDLRSEYRPIIEVNSVQKTENSPGETDNDYTINYSTGQVTFNSSQSGNTVVVKQYHYVVDSEWIIAPSAGKVIRLTQVEVQFCKDVELIDSIVFQLYVGGNPYGGASVFQTMYDFINESSLSYPEIPQMGGSGWRGMTAPVHIFRWPYVERGTTDLRSSLSMEVHVCLENDIELGGDFAVTTFYGVTEDE